MALASVLSQVTRLRKVKQLAHACPGSINAYPPRQIKYRKVPRFLWVSSPGQGQSRAAPQRLPGAPPVLKSLRQEAGAPAVLRWATGSLGTEISLTLTPTAQVATGRARLCSPSCPRPCPLPAGCASCPDWFPLLLAEPTTFLIHLSSPFQGLCKALGIHKETSHNARLVGVGEEGVE